jgi:hypothetical protein
VHEYKVFDYFPMLRDIANLLPLALNPVAQKATQIYHAEKDFFQQLYSEARERSKSDTALPS